jgi:hypothetical protein
VLGDIASPERYMKLAAQRYLRYLLRKLSNEARSCHTYVVYQPPSNKPAEKRRACLLTYPPHSCQILTIMERRSVINLECLREVAVVQGFASPAEHGDSHRARVHQLMRTTTLLTSKASNQSANLFRKPRVHPRIGEFAFFDHGRLTGCDG